MTRYRKRGTCIDCLAEREIQAKGLCLNCYMYQRRTGKPRGSKREEARRLYSN